MIKSLDFLAKCSKYFIGKSNFFAVVRSYLMLYVKQKSRKREFSGLELCYVRIVQ